MHATGTERAVSLTLCASANRRYGMCNLILTDTANGREEEFVILDLYEPAADGSRPRRWRVKDCKVYEGAYAEIVYGTYPEFDALCERLYDQDYSAVAPILDWLQENQIPVAAELAAKVAGYPIEDGD